MKRIGFRLKARRWSAFGLALLVAAAVPALAAVPTTTRTSKNSTGVQANADSYFPVVSGNGRWTAYESIATNLTGSPDVAGFWDVFVSDAKSGQTSRIAAPGTVPDGASHNASISGDGRWIVFDSTATNFVPGTTGGRSNVYLYERPTGVLKRLSNGAGGNGGNGSSTFPRISSDGTSVVFASAANDLVAGDLGKTDVFLYRLATGNLTRVSGPTSGLAPDGDALGGAVVSNGGRYVAFTSSSTNLVAGDVAVHQDIFVRDTQSNVITRASVTSVGGEANSYSLGPAISADGCQVAFQSFASNLVANDDKVAQIKTFVRDRCAGTTEIVSLTNDNPAKQANVLAERPPAISDDGCLVGMISATVIPFNGWRIVVARDRCQGFTSRMDISTGGDAGVGHTNGPAFSAGTARYVAFHSGAQNLVLGADANGVVADTFVRDRANAVPPVADLKVTANGRQATADASASRDPDADIASITIGFGDGTAAMAGASLTHDYLQTGTYTVTATVLDTDGLTTTATAPVTVTSLAPPASLPTPPVGTLHKKLPVLSKALLFPRRFVTVDARYARREGRGSRLTVTTSEAAKLTLRYERIRYGRKQNGRCSVTAARGKRCVRYTAAGTKLTAALVNGVNKLAITGRTSRGALAAGAYRLTLLATTPDRRASKPVRLFVTIVLHS